MILPFGTTPDGRAARLFVLENGSGFSAAISDYGATLVRLFVPDRQGRSDDVVLGFDTVTDYVARSPYFGGMIGRFANRIAGGRFTLEGRAYTLATNNTPGDRPCHLHGGVAGFDRRFWSAAPGTTPAGEPSLRLSYRSPDGEEGYPGTLDVAVTYALGADRTLRIDTLATSDAPTILNLTNHSYFNLAGAGHPTILDHVLELQAPAFTPVDAGLIPTGVVAPVAGTPLDFTTPQRIGDRIDAPHDQLRFAGGYDHNFVLAPSGRLAAASSGLAFPRSAAGTIASGTPIAPCPAARLLHPATGRVLEVLTTEPGLQFYSGNFLDGSFPAKAGRTYPHRSGLCLETQHFPDSPNQPTFPPTVLRPGETFRSSTLFRFSTA